MKRPFCLVALLILVTAARANDIDLSIGGAKPPDPAYVVSSDHADRLPRWSPDDHTTPPLEMNRVLEIVRTRIQTQLPNQEWRLSTAGLNLPGDPWAKRIPYYYVSIQYHPKGSTGDEAMYWSKAKWWYFVVLMDGTVLTHDPVKD